jgi:alanyl-tRNA synthetase
MVHGKKLYAPKHASVQGEKQISGKSAFELFTTYGFPIELTVEIAKERGLTVDLATFKKLMDEHRELSRKGAEHKFKGGLADHSDKVVAYHTATTFFSQDSAKNLVKACTRLVQISLRSDFDSISHILTAFLKKYLIVLKPM